MPEGQQTPESKPGTFRIIVTRTRTALGVMSWVVPIIIMAVGYYVFPPLRQTVGNLVDTPHDVFFGLFITLAAVVIWFFYEVWYAVSRRTSVAQLQLDGFISTFFSIVFTFVGATLINQDALPWWYVLPWVGTIADSLASSVLAINNAAQKPIVQSDPRA